MSFKKNMIVNKNLFFKRILLFFVVYIIFLIIIKENFVFGDCIRSYLCCDGSGCFCNNPVYCAEDQGPCSPPQTGYVECECVYTPSGCGGCDYSPSCTLNGQSCGNCGTYTGCTTACDGGCEGCVCSNDKTATGGACTTGSSCCSGLCIEGYCRSSCSGYSGSRCSNDTNAYTASASGVCARNNAGTWSCDKDEVSYYSTSHYTDCYEPFNGAPTSSIACDTDVDPSYTANGICTYTTGGASISTVNCDTDGSCFDGTNYRSQCSYCYSSGSTARGCDSDGGTSYSANGICVSGGSCDASGDACYDGSAYQSSCASCGYTLTDNDGCDTSVSDGTYSADGMCVANSGGSCVSSGPICNLTNVLYSGCSNCYTTGSSVSKCDSDGGTSFSANGICVSGGSCASGSVCYSGTAYYSSMSSCSQGNTCDSDVSNGAYSSNGVVYNNDGTNICCYGTLDYEYSGSGNACCLDGAILNSGSTSGSLLCLNGEFYDCGNGASTSPDADTDVTSGSCSSYGGLYCISGSWTSSLPPGCDCSSGSQCGSGLCIEGKCRDQCNSTYTGKMCSNDTNAYNAVSSGVCAITSGGIWSCSKNEVANNSVYHYSDCYELYGGAPNSPVECDNDVSPNYIANGICTYSTGGPSLTTVNCDSDETCNDGNYYRSQCSYCYSTGSTVRTCDSDGGISYSANGICVSGGSCASGSVCYSGTAYYSSMSSCSQGNTCDSDVSNGAYSSNGVVYNNDGTNICCYGTLDYEYSGSGNACCLDGAILNSGSTSGSLLCLNGEFYDCGNGASTSPDADTDVTSGSCSSDSSKLCLSGSWITASSPETACTDNLDNDCDGFTDCYDSDCPPCCTSNDGSCTTGSTCCSGLCIEGLCKATCNSTYSGQRCSNNTDSYTNSASGICARNNSNSWFCAKNEVAYYSSYYYKDCYDVFNGAPTSIVSCDTDVNPSYSVNGICAYSTGTRSITTVNCVSSNICYNGSIYRSSCSYCGYILTDNDGCDTSVSDGTYSADGMCVANSGGSCVSSGPICNLTNVLYSGCSNCYTTGSSVSKCDSDGGTSFSANGICVSGNTCDTSGHVCYDDSAYQSSCSLCSYDYDLDPQGDACDSNVGDATYTANGLCTYNDVCTSSGTTIRIDISNNNYFIAGCTNGGGDRCDVDGGTSFVQTGLCTQGYICDGSDVTYVSGIYYGNCSERGGYRCMSNAASGLFTQNGICFDSGGIIDNISFGCVVSGYVFYNGTHYKNSSQKTTNDYDYNYDNTGKSCDSSLTPGDYSQNGMVTLNGCTPIDTIVRVDKNNNYYFTEGCDNSVSRCGIVQSSLLSPFALLGICCSSSCVGEADSNCCTNTDCDGNKRCFNYKCVDERIGIVIKNLGITGFEELNNSFTSVRNVMLDLLFNATSAANCRYINYDDNTQLPLDNSPDWTQWEPCVSTKLWELTPLAGLKTVYYQINYSNSWSIANDSIYYNASGVGLDATPPNPPYIIDGDFTNNVNQITVSWYNASDPESDILNIPLVYKVSAFSNSYSTPAVTTTSTTQIIDISSLPLQNNSIIYINVTVINSAGLKSEAISDGVIVDTQMPVGTSLNGYFYNISNSIWTQFNYAQINENTYVYAKNINLTWVNSFFDLISGISAYSYVLSKDANAQVDDIPEGTIGNFQNEVSKIFTNLPSGKYYFKVKAKDVAGNWGLPISFNFSIDNTPPTTPRVLAQNTTSTYLTVKWTKSSDPESDVYGYNITLYDSLFNSLASYILADKTLDYYTFDLSSYSSDTYNVTIGAINYAGIIAWSHQTKYNDFTPPEIIAKPNNSVVISNEPILKVWTDEDAVCYYNNTKFIYTNTTYHETKISNLNFDNNYGFIIKCLDNYENEASVNINFLISQRTPTNIIILSPLNAYKNIKYNLRVNVTDNSNIALVGVSLDEFSIPNKEIYVFDNGDGTYNISFKPETSNYQIKLGSITQNLNLILKDIYLYTYYKNGVSPKALSRISYDDSTNIIGLASQSDISETSSQNISIKSGIEDSVFLIYTKPNQQLGKRNNQLIEKEFLNLQTPSFGYTSTDKQIISFILKYDFPIISNETVIQKGKSNYLIKNVKAENQKQIIFEKE